MPRRRSRPRSRSRRPVPVPEATPDPALDPILATDSPIAASKPAPIPVAKPRRSRGRLGILVGVLLLVGIIGGVAAFAGYLLLPSTSITVTPHIEAVGPVTFTVRADPTATSVDEAAAVVPAVTLTIPVSAQAEFPATGKRVERKPAKGAVRWSNCDPTSPYRIPSGTVVRTSGGEGFAINEAVFLPVAILSGGGATPKLECQTSEVTVTAVDPGPAGNVDAGTIRVVPASYNRNVIRVNNPRPTSGGSREEFTRISPKDVDAALEQLNKDLQAEFATAVANPSGVPEGTTPFPETAVLGEPVPNPDPASLVGDEVKSFNLELTAEGTVLAADASPAEGIAEQRLAASVADGYELVPDSTSIEVGEGTVVDGVIEFPVTGSAEQVRPLDAAALERSVLGLPIEDAKAVLAPYGDVVIVPWPDWVTTVPTMEQRVILTIAEPVDTGAAPAIVARDVTRRLTRRLAQGLAQCLSQRRPRQRRSGGPAGTIRRMSRILGVDLGERRIGLAVAESAIGGARPLATINRAKTIESDAEALARVCREQDVAELVVGLPIEASGVEGPMAEGARAWAAEIGTRLALPVALRDERLSSFEAEQRVGRMPRGRSGGAPSRAQRNAFRARIDREAAAVILQDELDARRAEAR